MGKGSFILFCFTLLYFTLLYSRGVLLNMDGEAWKERERILCYVEYVAFLFFLRTGLFTS